MVSSHLLALLALALAGRAGASPRLAIAPVKGDPTGRLGAQLTGALCAAHRCVPGTLAPGALAGGRSRLEQARKLGAEAAVFASVRRGRELAVALFTTGHLPARTWQHRLGRNGRLPGERLARLVAEIGAVLGRAPAQRPAAPPDPQPPPAAPPAPARLRVPPPARPQLAGVARAVLLPEAEPAPGEPPPEPAPRPEPPGPWIAAELGAESARYPLRFLGSGTASEGFAIDLEAAMRLRLELYPLRAIGGPAAGVALFGEAGSETGIPLPDGAATLRASLLNLRGGVRWRLQAGRWLQLGSALAWEMERLAVVAPDGARRGGASLAGPSMGLDLALLAGPASMSFLAGGRATWWFEGEGVGTALGVEAEAGIGLGLAGPISVRLLACHTARWWFDVDANRVHLVAATRSGTWGMRAWLRLEW